MAKVSVLALLVVCAMWARSGYASDVLWWSFGGGREYRIRSDWGRVIVTSFRTPGANTKADVGVWSETPGWADAIPGPGPRPTEHLGVQIATGRMNSAAQELPAGASLATGITYWRLRMYYPVPLLLAMLPLAPWLVARLRARRARNRIAAGLCGSCGYDLRGSAGGRCPECGSTAPQAPATSTVATVAPH